MRRSYPKRSSLFFIFVMLLSSSLGWGHGEDKPGPHGGFIRMPGAYHTEIVPDGTNKLKVYLLDVNWQNPSVKNSELSVSYQSEKKIQAVCKIKGSDRYLCSFPKGLDITKKGKLIVNSQREGQRGMEVFYDLPLKHEITHGGHKSHH